MADTVSTNVVFNGQKRYVATFLNVSDGTGESAVVKVDKSTLVGLEGGLEPSSLLIEMIEWTVDNMEVDLYWDHNTDIKILTCAGSSFIDYKDVGGLKDTGTGGSGDILFTTRDHVAGASYAITLHLRKKGHV